MRRSRPGLSPGVLLLRVLRAHQLGHVDPRAAVGEDHGEQDEAVGGSDQHDTQVHSDEKKIV